MTQLVLIVLIIEAADQKQCITNVYLFSVMCKQKQQHNMGNGFNHDVTCDHGVRCDQNESGKSRVRCKHDTSATVEFDIDHDDARVTKGL